MSDSSTSSSASTLKTDIGILLLRVAVPLLLIINHGFAKFQGVLSGAEVPFPDPIGLGTSTSFFLAMVAEFICASLLVAGLFTRIVAIIVAGNFLVVAYFHMAVVGDPFAAIELPLVFFTVSLALVFLGSGKFSVDQVLKNRKKA